MSVTPNALHLAERDGQLAAVRMLYALRWHLDAHDTSDDSKEAAAAFLDGFCDVFAPCVAEAFPEAVNEAALRDKDADRLRGLYAAIILLTPDLIAQLDR